MTSHVMEIAEQEAAEAEAEAAEEEEAEETVAEEAVEVDEASAQKNAEKAIAAIEKENVRHAKRVSEIMGDDFALVYPCTHCLDFSAGFTFTPPEEMPEMLFGRDYERCQWCNGHGKVKTHSVAEHGRENTCEDCNGQGYTRRPAAPLTPLPQPAQASPHASLANELRAQGYMVIDPPAPAIIPVA